MTNSALRLRTPDGVRAAVDALSGGHPVTRVDGGREPVWRIAPEDEHEAAFYRNTMIHAFLETSHRRARAGIRRARRRRSARGVLGAGDAAARPAEVRLLLRRLRRVPRAHRRGDVVARGLGEPTSRARRRRIDELLHAKRPLIAGAMLRPFFEAYEIVADVLRDAPAEIDEKELTEARAGRRPAVRRAGPGAQQRVGVGAAVRDRAPGGRRPASAGTGRRPRRTAHGVPAPNCAASSATWTRSSAISREQFIERETRKRTRAAG